MPPPGKTVKVYIYANDGEYRVHPAEITLNGNSTGGDDIEFVNQTGEDLVFYFGPDLFDADGFAEPVKKKGKKTTSKKAKSQGNNNTTISAYQIVAMPSGKKARANSDPVIIIDN